MKLRSWEAPAAEKQQHATPNGVLLIRPVQTWAQEQPHSSLDAAYDTHKAYHRLPGYRLPSSELPSHHSQSRCAATASRAAGATSRRDSAVATAPRCRMNRRPSGPRVLCFREELEHLCEQRTSEAGETSADAWRGLEGPASCDSQWGKQTAVQVKQTEARVS